MDQNQKRKADPELEETLKRIIGINTGGNLTANDINTQINLNTRQEFSEAYLYFDHKEQIATFVGRRAVIEELQNVIKAQGPSNGMSILKQLAVVVGLGGVGKTELVRNYSESNKDLYPYIVWINAETPATARDSFTNLAKNQLHIRTEGLKEDKHLVYPVFQKIFKKSCLLVYDNAESLDEEDGIGNFLPSSIQPDWIYPAIVVITRHSETWKSDLIRIEGLLFKEAEELFVNQLKLVSTPENLEYMKEIHAMCEGLPLALQQVIGFIQEERKGRNFFNSEGGDYGLREFLLEVKEKGNADFLAQTPADTGTSGKPTVLTIFNITFDKIFKRGGVVAILCLRHMSYLSPSNIPEELLPVLIPDRQRELTQAIKLMEAYGLIKCGEKYFEMHRIVQEAAVKYCVNNSSLMLGSEKEVLFQITRALHDHLERPGQGSMAKADLLLNGLHILPRIKEHVEVTQVRLFLQLLGCETKYSHFKESSQIYDLLENFYKGTEVSKFRNNENVLIRRCRALRDRGETEAAINILLYIFEHWEMQWRGNDRKRLKIEHSVALSYGEDEQYKEMEEGLLRVYQEQKRLLGEDDLDAIATYQDKGDALQGRRHYMEALEIYKEVLRRREAILDPNHPDLLTSKTCLATVYMHLGDHKEAIAIYKEVLEQHIRILGDNHPNTNSCRDGFAMVLRRERRFDEALELKQDVLQRREAMYGKYHPQTFTSEEGIAVIYREQGEYGEALYEYQNILDRRGRHLREDVPAIIKAEYGIAVTYAAAGKVDKALRDFKSVLTKQIQYLGPDHVETLRTEHEIADILNKMDKHDDALHAFQSLYERQKPLLGPNHPLVISTHQSIMTLLHVTGRPLEALESFDDLLENQQTDRDTDGDHAWAFDVGAAALSALGF